MSILPKSPTSKKDLVDIWVYIAINGGLSNADAFVQHLEDELRVLADNPHAGTARPELRPRLRSWPVGNFVIFYRPLKGGIEIARVVNGARDLFKVFGRRK